MDVCVLSGFNHWTPLTSLINILWNSCYLWTNLNSTVLSASGLEGDDDSLQQEVKKLLRVVLQNQAVHPAHCYEKHNSWVHCGRTKVFLTQSMVCHHFTPYKYTFCKQIHGEKVSQSSHVTCIRCFTDQSRSDRLDLLFGGLTCLTFVSQLDTLEDQRKKILSQCAFSIQCCWLRYQRHRRRTRRKSATVIQAGKLLIPLAGTAEWNQLWHYSWFASRNQLAASVHSVFRLTLFILSEAATQKSSSD